MPAPLDAKMKDELHNIRRTFPDTPYSSPLGKY